MNSDEKKRIDGMIGAFNGKRILHHYYKSIGGAKDAFYQKYRKNELVNFNKQYCDLRLTELWVRYQDVKLARIRSRKKQNSRIDRGESFS